MQISRFTLHTACLLLLMPALAGTQSGGRYDLMWSTVDGGSAVSAGGDYALDRTAGQPDAGTLSGSGFELSGGFWTIKVEIPTAARVIADESIFANFAVFNVQPRFTVVIPDD